MVHQELEYNTLCCVCGVFLAIVVTGRVKYEWKMFVLFCVFNGGWYHKAENLTAAAVFWLFGTRHHSIY